MSAFALLLAAISKQKTALCAVFLFPLFMASWLPLNLVSLLFRTRVWKEIEHGKTVHPALPAASLRRVPVRHFRLNTGETIRCWNCSWI